MGEVGSPLMTGAEQEEAGINTFGVITVTESFAEQHPELVRTFLRVTDEANRAFAENPAEYYDVISGAAGMDRDATAEMMANFGFPSAEEQQSEEWLGGGVQEAAKGVADVMVEAGNLDRALDDYSPFVDPSFLQ